MDSPNFQLYYKTNFREIFGFDIEPTDGIGQAAVDERLIECGIDIPDALRDYYAVAGYLWINSARNRLRPIEELEWYEDWLVFMDDEQGLISWGIHKDDLNTPDPFVWQGVLEERIAWLKANITVSQFLVEQWRESG